MLHVPKGTLREAWGRWLLLEVCRTVTSPAFCFFMCLNLLLPQRSPVMEALIDIQRP